MGWAFPGALLLVCGFLLWPTVLGGRTTMVVVSGDPMVPTIEPGDLAIARNQRLGDPSS